MPVRDFANLRDVLGDLFGPKRPAMSQVQPLLGVDVDLLRAELSDRQVKAGSPLALLIAPKLEREADLVEDLLALLAETALGLWPHWYGIDHFSPDENTALGHAMAGIRVRELQALIEQKRLLPEWADQAIARVLNRNTPRIPSLPIEIELSQLLLAIHPDGLILFVDLPHALDVGQTGRLGHIFDWLVDHGPMQVVPLLPDRPDRVKEWQRIMHNALRLRPRGAESENRPAQASNPLDGQFLGVLRGRPHHMSKAEQDLAKWLEKSPDLAPLFEFNQSLVLPGGHRYRPDLLWRVGRVVIEIDGADHFMNSEKYEQDCHRDFELQMSGYVILRLGNGEILRDAELCLAKIRDFVTYRRANWPQSKDIEQ